MYVEQQKELQSLRDMAIAMAEKATRMLAEREVQPVSTGGTKKNERERFLARRNSFRRGKI